MSTPHEKAVQMSTPHEKAVQMSTPHEKAVQMSTRAVAAVAFAMIVFDASGARAQEPLEPLPSPAASSAAPPTTTADAVTADAGVPPTAIADSRAPTPPKKPSGKAFRPSFKGAAGFQYAQVHGVPITGGRLRLGIGAQNDDTAFYANATVLYGSTDEGLRTWGLRGSISGDLLRVGLLRLGGDLEMGYLVVRRATVDARMWALGLGAGVHASIDAYAFGPNDDHAVFVEGKLDAHLHFGNAFMWGPSVLVGFRY